MTAPDCSLCGADGEGIHWLTVVNERTGETMDVDLCDGCLAKTRRYNRGEPVDWPTATDAQGGAGGR